MGSHQKQTPIKNFKELSGVQQKLFLALSQVIEDYAKTNKLNTKAGLYAVLETCVSVTLAMKSFYLLKNPEEGNMNETRN